MLFIFRYIFLRLAKQSQFIPVQNVVYFITLPFLVRKIFAFYINDVLIFKCPIPGQRVKLLPSSAEWVHFLNFFEHWFPHASVISTAWYTVNCTMWLVNAGVHRFSKIWGHLKILGVGRVTRDPCWRQTKFSFQNFFRFLSVLWQGKDWNTFCRFWCLRKQNVTRELLVVGLFYGHNSSRFIYFM